MGTEMISLRIDPDTKRRLEDAARTAGASRSALVARYVEEGLRMDAHPGIIFRVGPGGRRPVLPGGPDVWEVARIIRNSPERGEAAIEAVGRWSGLSLDQARIAVGYYAAYQAEIDDWLDRLDRQAEEAEAAWEREQDLLQ